MVLGWRSKHDPFRSTRPESGPPEIVLRQLDASEFVVDTPFEVRVGQYGWMLVSKEAGGSTDLASVPSYLGWFVHRHGRHTAAAITHDQLVRLEQRATHSSDPLQHPVVSRHDADTLFYHLLIASGVPPVRAVVMWLGVVLDTRFHAGRLSAAAITLWHLLALAGCGLFGWGVVTGRRDAVVAAAVGPLLGALLWGRQFVAGLLAGGAFVYLTVPSVVCTVFYLVYFVTEYGVYLLRRALTRDRRPIPGPEWLLPKRRTVLPPTAWPTFRTS